MKKSVIILLAVIYVLAIVAVGTLGLKGKSYDETVYVEKVTCTNEDIKVDSSGNKYAVIHYVADDEDPTTYYLEWKVTPDNATNKNVEFKYDEDSTVAYVLGYGAVVFNKKGVITVQICSTDGKAVCEKVKIYAK